MKNKVVGKVKKSDPKLQVSCKVYDNGMLQLGLPSFSTLSI
jgi:hypothetical protein